MPEGVPYASSNVIAGAGLELNYVGDHVFAYSGVRATSNTDVNLLSFTSGSKIIKADVFFGYLDNDNKSFEYKILFNSVLVSGWVTGGAGNQANADISPIIPIVIPPYTEVLITAKNISSPDSVDQCATLTGRVYG